MAGIVCPLALDTETTSVQVYQIQTTSQSNCYHRYRQNQRSLTLSTGIIQNQLRLGNTVGNGFFRCTNRVAQRVNRIVNHRFDSANAIRIVRKNI